MPFSKNQASYFPQCTAHYPTERKNNVFPGQDQPALALEQ
jgi:hypothetical protein